MASYSAGSPVCPISPIDGAKSAGPKKTPSTPSTAHSPKVLQTLLHRHAQHKRRASQRRAERQEGSIAAELIELRHQQRRVGLLAPQDCRLELRARVLLAGLALVALNGSRNCET